MPLYEYKCGKCNLRFEELKTHKEHADVVQCPRCGKSAEKLVSAFSHSVSGGSMNETVDMKIGREANNRWQRYHDNRNRRIGGKELQTFDLPKGKDGKYQPVMAIGDKKDVSNRKEYVTALQDHVKKRQEKGLKQFDSPGAF